MTETLTIAQYRDMLKRKPNSPRKNKFGNTPVTIDGRRFASVLEGRRYSQLRLLERGAQIFSLRLQPRYPLHAASGGEVCEYVADFAYKELRRVHGIVCVVEVVEDAKGMPTAIYKLKIKMFKQQYPHIYFREVSRAR